MIYFNINKKPAFARLISLSNTPTSIKTGLLCASRITAHSEALHAYPVVNNTLDQAIWWHVKQAPVIAVFLLFFAVFTNHLYGQDFKLEKLPATVNSLYDEISPVPTRDGKALFFTRVAFPVFNKTLFIDSVDMAVKETPEQYRKSLQYVFSQIAGHNVNAPEQSSFNQEVWVADMSDSNSIQIIHPPYPLNNALPNSLVTITPDPNVYYIVNRFEKNGNMDRGFSSIRQTTDSTWSFPEPVDIKDYYTITSDVCLTMSFDGKVLILSATRFDSRDMDLYVCFRTGRSQWSAPVHMGKVINSEKRETTPFLSEDNMTLFFSSNRWNAQGGNDIFMSRRQDSTWTNWSEPVRLVEPINSRDDDGQPYFNMTSGYLYFTSKRDGNSDIFRVQIAPPQPTEMKVNGRILNKRMRELVTGGYVQYGMAENQKTILPAPDGTFSFMVLKGVNFEAVAAKSGYTGIPMDLYFRRDYYYFRDFEIEVLVDPLEVDAKIELKPIFFEQSKAVILESSFAELDRLAGILTDNPGVYIRVEGHTDNHGNPEGLQRLSEERAAAIRQFLLDKGIAAERLETIGYGAQFPISDNSTDEMRAKNRRVEVRITKIIKE